MFSKFEANIDLYRAVMDWENGRTDTIMINGEPAEGTAPGGPNIGQPVFQYKSDPRTPFDGNGVLVAETDNCIAFIPAGFRDAKTTRDSWIG